MFELPVYQARREALLAGVGQNAIVVIPSATELRRSRDTEFLFRQDSDFFYLTGFNEPDAVLVLYQDNNESVQHLFCRAKDKMAEIWQGRRLGADAAVSKLGLSSASTIDELDEQLAAMMNHKTRVCWPIGEYGKVDETLYQLMNQLRAQPKTKKAPTEIHDVRPLLHEMRLRKSEAEIAVMLQAGQISSRAHARAMQFCKPGVMEYQIEAELHHEFAMAGARFPAYNSIVAGGLNACILHYTENQDELHDGELLLIDAGCELQGYAADITRTFPVNGQFSEPQRQIYQLVLACQQQVIVLVKPGVTITELMKKTCELLSQGLIDLGLLEGDLEQVLQDKSYRKFFMHGVSHWLGLDVHDVGDYKVDGQDRPLQAGMVITVEPGIYIDDSHSDIDSQWLGIGVRIEDNILVTESGHQNLTQACPKSVEDIEALMAQS